MIKLNDTEIIMNHFPDGTFLLKKEIDNNEKATITWLFESNEELVALYFLTKHLNSKGITNISLRMPYIPNARQDRVKKNEDVFTLKYFAEMINSLGFTRVTVLDPHSYVSEALIDRINVETPEKYVDKVLANLKKCGKDNIILFFPDEGAMKRYSAMFNLPYVFGIKKRDWVTGEIKGLTVSGQTENIKNSTILIIDDICSRGGTFYHSAVELDKLGAEDIYLYVSHCENTILEGEIINSDLIKKVYTTNSIYNASNNIEKVEVFDYE